MPFAFSDGVIKGSDAYERTNEQVACGSGKCCSEKAASRNGRKENQEKIVALARREPTHWVCTRGEMLETFLQQSLSDSNLPRT